MFILQASVVLYVFPIVISHVSKPVKHCTSIKTDVMDDCDNYDLDSKMKTRIADNSTVCHHPDICRRNVSITLLPQQLHALRTLMHFSQALDKCCGQCMSYGIYKEIDNLDEIDTDILQKSDIITPMLGSRSVSYLHGFYYIPIVSIPSSYYVTLACTEKEKMLKLVMGCFNTWPLILICVLFSLISGLVIWLFERRQNGEEFPERFHIGIYEGFWWSFISMTTVGYGDRCPKSLFGRAYAVIWVLIGITIFSILTGELTNQISKIQAEPNPDLLGKTVGGLMHKLEDTTIVTQHNGFFKGMYFSDTVKGITALIKMLKNKEIDGFLINRATFYVYRHSLMTHGKRKQKYAEDKRIFEDSSFVLTEKDFIGEKKTIGMMVKDYKLYQYIKSYFEDNRVQLENCASYRLNDIGVKYKLKEKKVYNITGHFGTVFYPVIAIIVLLAVFGVIVEVRRKRVLKNTRKDRAENFALTSKWRHLGIITKLLLI